MSWEISEEARKAKEQAVVDAYRPICLCNKIRKGIIVKAIQTGADSFEKVRQRTRAGTGPCGAARCGPMIRGMLGEPVETCRDCGWSILIVPGPLTCPRCGASRNSNHF
ncbi:MAG: (2Fe-2S)-binding protein [Deltaproteobacteria bacterium]|nr:(2Fe-2S)-binding protein [Deltaproteobacteria bacterium]